MAKPILGPWTVNAIGDVRTADGQDRFVASVFGRGLEEKTATAHLIAAAPELLEALSQCRTALGQLAQSPVHGYLALADKALAKAEGKVATDV